MIMVKIVKFQERKQEDNLATDLDREKRHLQQQQDQQLENMRRDADRRKQRLKQEQEDQV